MKFMFLVGRVIYPIEPRIVASGTHYICQTNISRIALARRLFVKNEFTMRKFNPTTHILNSSLFIVQKLHHWCKSDLSSRSLRLYSYLPSQVHCPYLSSLSWRAALGSQRCCYPHLYFLWHIPFYSVSPVNAVIDIGRPGSVLRTQVPYKVKCK